MYNVQSALRKLQENPGEFLKRAGVNVPDEIIHDPQAIVMHLIQTGQVSGQMMERVMPMIKQLNTTR